jgi:hypothetical protein
VRALQGRVSELESELESSRHEAGSAAAALEQRLRERERRLEGAQVRGLCCCCCRRQLRLVLPLPGQARLQHPGLWAAEPERPSAQLLARPPRCAQEELEHQREQLAALEKLVRERSAALAEARERAAAAGGEREAGEATLRDLAARHSKVLADKQVGGAALVSGRWDGAARMVQWQRR